MKAKHIMRTGTQVLKILGLAGLVLVVGLGAKKLLLPAHKPEPQPNPETPRANGVSAGPSA